ncbi:MAG: MarR family transcriptional regulator [Ancrocorticia sp.]
MIDSKREDELRRDVEMLYFGYRAFTSLADSILAEYGLGRSHHRILYFVQRDPGISVGDLVLVLKVTKQAIHRPLKELEERGLLTVTPDPQDRRFRRVTTTASGAELEERLTGAQTRLLEEVFAEFDEATEVRWRHVMMRLAETDE